MSTQQETLVSLKPEEITIKDNIRFGLKPYRIERLAEEILHDGGVNTPIEVQQLEDGSFILTAGHYRVAAVEKLNREQSAGLTLPARVVPIQSEVERTLRQISENNERENLSPIDRAIGMAKLKQLGVSPVDIRKAFAIAGGRKGLKVAMASNSHINMTMSFLDFPKNIQQKIHDGTIGTGAAYELTKYPRDKWQPILDRAENERIKGIERDEKDEEAFLKAEKEVSTKTVEIEKAEKEFVTVKETATKASEVVKAKADALTAAFNQKVAAKSKEDKAKANEHFKSVEAELKSAEDTANKAAKELAKIEEKRKAIADKAQAARERLEAARKAKSAKKAEGKGKKDEKPAAPVSGKAIKKAAKTEGASEKAVKLNATEMREVVKSLVILSVGKYQKTGLLGTLLEQAFDGKITDGQLHVAVAKLFGEMK